MHPKPALRTLFPYTTLFRSKRRRPPIDFFRKRRLFGVISSSSSSRIHSRFCSGLMMRGGVRSTPSSAVAERMRSEEDTSELQSLRHIVCRLLVEKEKPTNES